MQIFFMILSFVLASSALGESPCFSRQDLLAKSAGFLAKVLVKDGQTVKRGESIIELDSRLLKTALQEAQAGIMVAEANLALAKDTSTRLGKLRGSKSVSDQEWFAAKIKVDQANAALLQAQAILARTKIQNEDTVIKAELDGKVLGVPQVLGLYVQPGQSLGRIESKELQCLPIP